VKKPWSILTTVRNPGRLRDFLGVLKTLESEPFNSEKIATRLEKEIRVYLSSKNVSVPAFRYVDIKTLKTGRLK